MCKHHTTTQLQVSNQLCLRWVRAAAIFVTTPHTSLQSGRPWRTTRIWRKPDHRSSPRNSSYRQPPYRNNRPHNNRNSSFSGCEWGDTFPSIRIFCVPQSGRNFAPSQKKLASKSQRTSTLDNLTRSEHVRFATLALPPVGIKAEHKAIGLAASNPETPRKES